MTEWRLRDRLVSIKHLPEALLVVSVLSLSPPWIKYLVSAVERGGGELRLVLSILLAFLPTFLLIITDIEHMRRAERVRRFERYVNPRVIEKGYMLFLAALLAAQILLTMSLWLEVQALEATGVLLRFYVLMIPLNSIAVLALAAMFAFSEPGEKVHTIQILLSALMVVFSILALGYVSSMLAT